METYSLTDDMRHLSRLGLGGCPFGGHGWGPVDDRDSIHAIRRAYELGVNFFDTADVYGFGHSEHILRKALGPSTAFGTYCNQIRGSVGRTGSHLERCQPKLSSPGFGCQLVAFGSGMHRSLTYLHWYDLKTPIEKTLEALEELRRQGKIRAIGLSNVTAEQLRTAASIAPIATVQIQYSLVDQEKFERLAPVARQLGIRLTTWGSLAQGLLSGKYDGRPKFDTGDRRLHYDNFLGEKLRHNLLLVQELKNTASQLGKTPAQVALRWLLDTRSVGFALFGAKNIKQVEENLGALGWRLPCEAYQRLMQLGCTASGCQSHDPTRKTA